MSIANSTSKIFVLSINGVTSGHYEVSKCLLASLYPGNIKRYIIIRRKYNHLIGRFDWFIALITEGALLTKIKFPILSDVYCCQYLYDLNELILLYNTWQETLEDAKVVIRSRELKKVSQYYGQTNYNVDIKFSAHDAFLW